MAATFASLQQSVALAPEGDGAKNRKEERGADWRGRADWYLIGWEIDTTPTLEDFDDMITKYRALYDEISSLPCPVSFGWIRVNPRPVITVRCSLCVACILWGMSRCGEAVNCGWC